jgi:MoaA/NifB/PqqE/SkfB family radical SAM enzyme
MVIASSGVVQPCCYWNWYGTRNPPMGNANEQSLEEIWNGPGYQKLRKHMAEGNLQEAGCAQCFAVRQNEPLGFLHDQDADQDGSTPYAQNLKLLKKEIAGGATVLKARPTIISLTPSHRCNIRCTHCYQEATRARDLGNNDLTQEVLGLAPSLVRLNAGGGEPFLQPIWRQFLKDFDRAENPCLDFATTTNATMITPEVEEGLRKFKKVTFNVSLDGTGAAFERVRVGASFAQVRENIRKLRAVARGSESPHSTTNVTMCVMKSNVRDIPNLIRFAAEEEVTYALSPVATEPPDESLTCFNDPAAETAGWHQAYDEARRVACDVYLPMLSRLKKSPLGEDYANHLVHNIELIRQCTPWQILEKEHYRVRIEVPGPTLATLGANVHPRHRLMAYIYPEAMPINGPPPYYAFFTGNHFEVSLPQGAYLFGVSSKWVWSGPLPGLRFVVEKGRKEVHVICSDSMQAPSLWDRLRGHIKVYSAPYPRLSRWLKLVHDSARRCTVRLLQ